MTHDPIADSTLIACAHGELSAAEREALHTRLRDDPEARQRLAVFARVTAALDEALDRDASPLARGSGDGTARGVLRLLFALAGVAVVAAVFALTRGGVDEAQGRNERLELRVKVGNGGHLPLFLDGGLELHWRDVAPAPDHVPWRLLPFPRGRTLEQLRDEVDAATRTGPGRQPVLPIVLSAEITGPDGSVLHGRYAPVHGRHFDSAEPTARLDVKLRDFEVDLGGLQPKLVGGPGEHGWLDETMWSQTHLRGSPRLYPVAPGTYTFVLRVETLPTPTALPWPTFATPLVVRTVVLLDGTATDWGQVHDGMQARLVWSEGCPDPDTAPFALQLRNVSGRDRTYNHWGTTIAKIPQPMHYTLIVDGEPWTQIDRVPVVIAAVDQATPHATDTVRTLVQRAGYWTHDGKGLATRPGRHRVQVAFHFEPSFWNAADTSIWMGELHTPELAIDLPVQR